MEITELLINDHHEVNQLFGRFSRASKPETLDELAKQIIHELSVHAAIEEQFVYPVVRVKVANGSRMADHGIEEHHEVKQLLVELEKGDASTAGFAETMKKVASAVHDHVGDEEGEVLPALREATGDGLRDKLGALAEGAKSLVPTHPHPLVPGKATAQMVAGPWASLLDRTRDLVGLT